eukprot:scpid101414/ scgid4130/ Sushi, von Willebrand factor type A, EGF and pentraxin domain-containing protein 1; CCP module-containing protein 22; Polydom; Selectin-like osteoblast-derived protein; Serologically defined breast cancer antigen NY-BR-38
MACTDVLTVIACARPAMVENCAISYRSTAVGSRAVHTCARGYQLVGNARTICQTNGQWSQQPSCRAMRLAEPAVPTPSCATPSGIRYGQVWYTGTAVGSKVMYRCNHGYERVGNARVTCLSNGQWSAGPARCQRRTHSGSSSDDGVQQSRSQNSGSNQRSNSRHGGGSSSDSSSSSSSTSSSTCTSS